MDEQRSHRDQTVWDRPTWSSRRRVLAGLGASLGAAALAGCSGLADDTVSYENGEVADVGDEERTAEEMTAAESVAEREINEGITPLNELSIEDQEGNGPTV